MIARGVRCINTATNRNEYYMDKKEQELSGSLSDYEYFLFRFENLKCIFTVLKTGVIPVIFIVLRPGQK